MKLKGSSHGVSKAKPAAAVATYRWLGWAVHIVSMSIMRSGLRHLPTRQSPGSA